MAPDWIVAGLGNPGTEYASHRHNVGHWLVNRLARRHHADLRASKSMSSAQVQIGDSQVLFMKTRTWVNTSGDAIGPLMHRLKMPPERLIVIYDEIDLPEGRIRLRAKGGHGGHNGLKSIIAAIGSSDFGRIRIGLGRPVVNGEPSWDPRVVARWVLGAPPKDERQQLDAAVERAADAVEMVITQGWDRAMNVYNTAE